MQQQEIATVGGHLALPRIGSRDLKGMSIALLIQSLNRSTQPRPLEEKPLKTLLIRWIK